ncbi:MAG: hypothetical protein ACI4C3_01125 [Bacteroides sp.]
MITNNCIKALDAISKLVEEDLLFVDYRTPSVILSSTLHKAFMDDELKKQRAWYKFLRWMGCIRDDYRYIGLMKNIRLYINMLRASNDLEYFLDKVPLTFMVSSIDKQRILLEGIQTGNRIEY